MNQFKKTRRARLLLRSFWLGIFLARPIAARAAPPAPQEDSPAASVVWFSGEGLFNAGVALTNATEAWAGRHGLLALNTWRLFGISGTQWLLSLVLLLGVIVFSGAILRLVRLRVGRLATPEKQTVPQVILSAARKPLALVLLVYGGYFALVPLLVSAHARSGDMKPLGAGTATADTLALFWLLFRLITGAEKRLTQWAHESRSVLAAVMPFMANSSRVLIPLIAVFSLEPLLNLSPGTDHVLKTILAMGLIGSLGYILIAFASALERALLSSHSLQGSDNLSARKIYTQVSVLKRIFSTTIAVITVGCMLMLFAPVRQLGTSILASAGIAGIILGFAAQKTLGNLIAGVQIALTQPIRIDDVVVVENEWGRIEEITLTYVVVQIWDLRRLVLPITYFVEKPFQNWTRQSSRILGSVMLYVDYHAPLDELRAELRRIAEASPLWDREVCGLQVTETNDRTQELRVLVSASDAPKAFDLRCDVREKLIRFLFEKYPECLPRQRAEIKH